MTFFDMLGGEDKEGILRTEPTVVQITEIASTVFKDINDGKERDYITQNFRIPWERAFFEYRLNVEGHHYAHIGVLVMTTKSSKYLRSPEWLGVIRGAKLPEAFADIRNIDKHHVLGSVYLHYSNVKEPPSIDHPILQFAYLHNEDGTKVPGSNYFKNRPSPNPISAEAIPGLLLPFHYALRLLHCKNVITQDHVTPPKLAAARIRRGKPPGVTFKTLAIQLPKGRGVVPLTRPGANGAPNARHIVRGHFKRYTKERPLLGRHVGEFFFPEHVRGRDPTRRIVKDYRLEGDS